jgi:hypothetical protein
VRWSRAVDLYFSEIDEDYRTVRFNMPANPDDDNEFLDCNKKNINIIDAFFADNAAKKRALSRLLGNICCQSN